MNEHTNMKLERAVTLDAMVRVFRPEPLDEASLEEFYYSNTMLSRTGDPTDSPLEDLFEDCIAPLGSNAHLLSGHSGCGKSTEFARLRQRFEEMGYPAIIINTQRDMNLNLADCWDIMLFIAYGLCEVAEQNKIKLPGTTLRAMFDYLRQDMEETKTTESSSSVGIEASAAASATFGIGAVLKLFASIKSNLQLGAQTRLIIKEKFERRASEWMLYVNEISDIIADASNGKQPIIIFEDLDKIQPYERAFDIFSYDTLAKMPFPIIYTFPIAATYDARCASIDRLYKIHIFPMIKVSNEDKSENNEGIDTIRKIVGLRADLGLFEDVSRRSALEIMIKQTGGVLRQLFECITTASRRARRRGAERIEMEDARRALSDMASMLSRRISMDEYPMLINIIRDAKYREHIENRESLLKLMHGLIVLEYKNGDRWQDVHPLIADFLTKQGVVDEASDTANR